MGDVDVLFNNAGYGLGGPLEGVTDEQLRQQLDTNLLGTIRTTQAFLPHFRQRRQGTVITTTSIGGLVAFPFFSVYHATKWALEGWSDSMAFEMKPFGVRMKTVAPGGIATDFAGRSLVFAQHADYGALIQKTFATFQDPERRAQGSSSEQIAEIVYEAATDGTDQRRYVAGKDAQAHYALRNELGSEAFHDATEKRFFG
jgi:NAD(P)-dependent dehydrogenase (short-subunit alcohol dehydrogenase family)